jgi:DNA-binding response OmpR family regulator
MNTTQELKVLLLEYNPGDAFLIKFYLGESTAPVFNVSHAETVKGALELLSTNTFHIIISDMNLPDSFGVDTIRQILSNYPGNLVIVLTGLTDEEVGLETVRYGAQDFLVKGKFDGKVLVSSVMFAFERFKLNKKIDSVREQLNAENSRLELIQKLLNVSYLEIDLASKQTFHSGASESFTLDYYKDAYPLVADFDALKLSLSKSIEDQIGGEHVFQRTDNGRSYTIKYIFDNNKIFGVIQES